MRRSVWATWAPWCAVILLALLGLTLVHDAARHNGTQRDCAACKALRALPAA